MAVDSVIDWPCEVKKSLQAIKKQHGLVQLVELRKTQLRIGTLARLAQQSGKSEDQVAITIQVAGPPGRENTRQVTLTELRADVVPLELLQDHCEKCAANILGQAYTCVQFLQYPIPAAAEQWLLDRLQPLTTPGGFLLLAAFSDHDYNGQGIAEYRSRGLFEARTPLVKTYPANRFNRTEITTDQLFHPLFSVGVELENAHLMMVLMWFGMITLDGKVPSTPVEFKVIAELTPAERKERCTLELGPAEELPKAGDFANWFRLMFKAWQLDQPLFVDS